MAANLTTTYASQILDLLGLSSEPLVAYITLGPQFGIRIDNMFYA